MSTYKARRRIRHDNRIYRDFILASLVFLAGFARKVNFVANTYRRSQGSFRLPFFETGLELVFINHGLGKDERLKTQRHKEKIRGGFHGFMSNEKVQNEQKGQKNDQKSPF